MAGPSPDIDPSPGVAGLVDRALLAYDALVEVAELVEDEWQYVTDLSGAWRARLNEVAAGATGAGDAAHGTVPLAEMASAVDAAAAEIASITDPHRAIDWLSTYPQVVLLALGARP